MAKPRVFVSSTYYDLKHVRSSLESFIENQGYEPILFKTGDIPYAPDGPLDKSCYKEIESADIFILIIGGRYGSPRSDDKTAPSQKFYDKYNSITKNEYSKAAEKNIPIYIFIDKNVYSEYEFYLDNKEKPDLKFKYTHSINIFKLIEDISKKPQNNPTQKFERFSDIEIWLKQQWAGLFRELLSRMREQQKFQTISSQVAELKEINQTLKTYLEKVMGEVLPKESEALIEEEKVRLFKEEINNRILSLTSFKDWYEYALLSKEAIINSLKDSNTIDEFIDNISENIDMDSPYIHTNKKNSIKKDLRAVLINRSSNLSHDVSKARLFLNLPQLKKYEI